MKKQNVDRARSMRAEPTPAETMLWRCLRDRRHSGYKFCRQEPIGPFIVDFVCRRNKLVIEVDGGQHSEQEGQDAERTHYLRERGYEVIWFWNDDVLSNIEGVWRTIEEALRETRPLIRPPTAATFSPKGRRKR
jgi:very-short-patch-repair endonuclease